MHRRVMFAKPTHKGMQVEVEGVNLQMYFW